MTGTGITRRDAKTGAATHLEQHTTCVDVFHQELERRGRKVRNLKLSLDLR